MQTQGARQGSLGFFGRKPILIEVSDKQLSTDAGLLPIREFDESLGFTQQFADALNTSRREGSVLHSNLEITRS